MVRRQTTPALRLPDSYCRAHAAAHGRVTSIALSILILSIGYALRDLDLPCHRRLFYPGIGPTPAVSYQGVCDHQPDLLVNS